MTIKLAINNKQNKTYKKVRRLSSKNKPYKLRKRTLKGGGDTEHRVNPLQRRLDECLIDFKIIYENLERFGGNMTAEQKRDLIIYKQEDKYNPIFKVYLKELRPISDLINARELQHRLDKLRDKPESVAEDRRLLYLIMDKKDVIIEMVNKFPFLYPLGTPFMTKRRQTEHVLQETPKHEPGKELLSNINMPSISSLSIESIKSPHPDYFRPVKRPTTPTYNINKVGTLKRSESSMPSISLKDVELKQKTTEYLEARELFMTFWYLIMDSENENAISEIGKKERKLFEKITAKSPSSLAKENAEKEKLLESTEPLINICKKYGIRPKDKTKNEKHL